MARFNGQQKTAEVLFAEAMEADNDAWIVYVVGSSDPNQLPFNEWLEYNSPSRLSRKDGVGWISICQKARKDGSNLRERDVEGLMLSWENLQKCGQEITASAILSLAKTHHVTCGKWLAHAKSGPHIDQLWTTIATAIAENRMDLALSAKVSPLSENEDGTHVVCVYNNDCTNEAQIRELEAQLRKIGVHTQLLYKPDAYTHLGIYRNNSWKMSPTLYKSDFNVVLGCSQILRKF